MIEINEEDVFQYLMTSDFHETYSPDEYRFLLNKWRYYYRALYGQHSRMKEDLDDKLGAIELEKETCRKTVAESESKVSDMEKKYQSLINKELSWTERLKGKIIQIENED